jgi:hypothetical protein
MFQRIILPFSSESSSARRLIGAEDDGTVIFQAMGTTQMTQNHVPEDLNVQC